jgi:starch-binding outer membrane protein SusE/F
MKQLLKYFSFLIAIAVVFTACDKKDTLPAFAKGTTPVLTASATTIAPVAADSNNTALTLNWTFPKYATDSATIKYVIEIDSTTKNFANPYSIIVNGAITKSFIAKELNSILLSKGYAFNVPVDMDVRVISSYQNNNERLISNTVTIKMTPYKIPPKVALPASGKLFIVGSATQGGWTNPVPLPSQELARIDETTFGGIFQLNAGGSYLFLPVNGDWSAKYGFNGPNNSNNVNGDNLKAEGGDMMAPAANGLYKIIVDFQQGKFTVTPFTQQHGLPTELYIVGDATPGGWANPVPVPSQKFTRLNATTFEIASLALTSGKKYLFLPTNGDWSRKYGSSGAASNTKLDGTFAPEGGDMDSPDVSGNYKITFNILNNTYKLVKL